MNFIIVSTGDKYSTLHFAEFELDQTNTTLKLIQRKHNNLNYIFIPLGGTYHHPYVYTVGNSPTKGPIIMRYHTEENSVNRGKLNISSNLQRNMKESFVRKYLDYFEDDDEQEDIRKD